MWVRKLIRESRPQEAPNKFSNFSLTLSFLEYFLSMVLLERYCAEEKGASIDFCLAVCL